MPGFIPSCQAVWRLFAASVFFSIISVIHCCCIIQGASQLPDGVSAYAAALQQMPAVAGGIKRGLGAKSLTAVLGVFAADASAASTSRTPLPVPGLSL